MESQCKCNVHTTQLQQLRRVIVSCIIETLKVITSPHPVSLLSTSDPYTLCKKDLESLLLFTFICHCHISSHHANGALLLLTCDSSLIAREGTLKKLLLRYTVAVLPLKPLLHPAHHQAPPRHLHPHQLVLNLKVLLLPLQATCLRKSTREQILQRVRNIHRFI